VTDTAIRDTLCVPRPAAERGKTTAALPTWPDQDANGLRSAMYEGIVTHARFGPGPTHSFTAKVAMPLLDLAEVDEVMGLHPAWSARRRAPVHFRRQDFLGDPTTSLDQAVRDLVADRTGRRPDGPVALLAHLRTWGWLFNPISLYFCADAGDLSDQPGRSHSLVAEVENTPWHQRHAYVVGPPGRHRFAKELHVSPFLPPNLDYELRYTAPGPLLTVGLDVFQDDCRLFAATLRLRRGALDRAALGRLVWNHPAATHRVTGAIYAQAAQVWLKGAPFFGHPERRSRRPATLATGSCPVSSGVRRPGP
jgi:DUF1365 family protein